jgi:VIT1/CCC1 family predicted Fe2+/Mn2+ transporter
MKSQTLEVLIWVMIYGGLLLLVAGLAVSRSDESDVGVMGSAMIVMGAVIAALGFAGIYLRSRMNDASNKKHRKGE